MQFITTLLQQGIQNPDGLEKVFTFMQKIQSDDNNQNLPHQE